MPILNEKQYYKHDNIINWVDNVHVCERMY